MTRSLCALMLAAAMPPGLCLAEPAPAPTPIRRFALVVGANRGAADRVPLRYAVADAERFADVVTRMGGVSPGDRVVLREPTRQALLDALTATHARAAQAQAERVEVVVYFSGHADDQGLMLGRELLPYRELRAAVRSIHADVGITILDACASGAITRLKGGAPHPAFLSDASSEVQGYAFLTSSSETEAAQESERLRGSFFTHALLTGLRGAADVSGDGKVTLNEAYQFAFHETLVQTTTTQGGTQHPAYDIKMAGTGDVVMTDVRQNSSSLILGEAYDGRFLVLNARRHLVAELYKPAGRRIELGLEPGEYDVYFEQDKLLLSTSLKLADGQRLDLVREELKPTQRLPAQRRGGESFDTRIPDLKGRFRAQLGWGTRFTFSHWLKSSLALQLTFGQRTFGPPADRDILLGVGYFAPLSGRLKPHAGLSLGRFGWSNPSWVELPSGGTLVNYSPTTRWGAGLSVGLDYYLDGNFCVSLDSQGSFAGGRHSIDTWMSVGWSFGGAR